MKQKLLLKTMLLLCALIVGGVSSAWADTTDELLSENFSSITKGNSTSTSGSNTSWSGNTNFPTVSTAYQAGGAVKIGSGSNKGSITSKSLNVNAGTLTVAFDVKGWSNVEGSIKVTVGSQNSTVSYTATMSGSFESKSVNFTIATSGSITVKLETTAKRAFLDNIVISNTYTSGPVDLTKFEFDNKTPSISLTKNNGSYDGTYTQTVSFLPNTYTGDIYYWIDYDNSTFSNDEAEVDISTGEVTIMRESNVGGTIKVVASGEAVTDMFNEPDDATYTLTVNPYKPAAPTFSTEGGAVDYGTSLTLTSGYTIKYTTDGTTIPSASVGTTYENAIVLKDGCTVKAVAIDGNDVSDVASFDFTIKTPDNVTLSPAGGNSANKTPVQYGTQVTMTHPMAPTLGTIRYTTNGTIPANQITEHPDKVFPYTEPITITADIRIKPQFQTDNGLYWSASAPDNYYVIATPDAPEPGVASGTEVAKDSKVTLSHDLLTNNLGKIYYTETTDGTEPAEPTAESTEYTDGITINVDKKIKARFITNGDHLGEIASLEYTYIRTAAGLAYAETSFEAPINSDFTEPTLTNPHELTITYESSDETIATVNAAGEVTILSKEGDVTITARSARDATYYAGEASYTITVYDPSIKGTKWNPFTVAEALAFIDGFNSESDLVNVNSTTDLVSKKEYFTRGIVSHVGHIDSGTTITQDGSLYYYISDDGTTSNHFEVWLGKSLNSDNFTNSNILQEGDEVVVCGKLEKYGSTPYYFDYSYLTYFKRRQMPNLAFGGESEKTVTLTQGETLTGVAFTKAEGINLSDITFTASYNDVASVSTTGVITLGSSTGTSVITATFAKNDDYNAGKATCTITVNPSGVTPEPSASGHYVKVTSTNDMTDGQYLFVYETENVAFNGALTTLDAASNTVSVNISGGEIEATEAINNAAFTYTASNGSFKNKNNVYLKGKSGGIDTSSNPETHTITFDNDGNAAPTNSSATMRFNTYSGQKRFRYYGSSSSIQTPIQLYKFVPGETPSTIDVFVSEAGLATYASNFDLDYSSVVGLEAYKASVTDDAISFTRVNQVPAGAGILLRSTNNGTSFSVPVATGEVAALEDNAFIRGTGAAVASEDNGHYNYILNIVNNRLGFYAANGQTVATNRAYLQTTTQSVRGFAIFFDENTGIATLEDNRLNDNAYDMQGRRVSEPKRGLYIINGKKTYIK